MTITTNIDNENNGYANNDNNTNDNANNNNDNNDNENNDNDNNANGSKDNNTIKIISLVSSKLKLAIISNQYIAGIIKFQSEIRMEKFKQLFICFTSFFVTHYLLNLLGTISI